MFNRLISFLLLFCTLAAYPAGATEFDWSTFKQRFMASDGRIMDTGNHNVSHTEGQGYALLFAVAAGDKTGFERIWHWTDSNLRDPQTGLFFWRYNPVVANPIEDHNNASDGDLLIAWALLKAASLWQNPSYQLASDGIVQALLKHTVVNFAGYTVMLPGRQGFQLSDSLTLNPSYFIFPAWRDLAQHSHLTILYRLMDDAQRLLTSIDWGRSQVPSDWLSLQSNGKTTPAAKWPARVSYDAIRVPIYIKWVTPDHLLLARWQTWFGRYPRTQTPAWESVNEQSVASYNMSGGLLAARDLTMNRAPDTRIHPQDDYYSASLKLLSALAEKGF